MSDLISRHGVSVWLDNLGYSKLSDYVMDEDRFPSAEPECKTGEWKLKEHLWECDKCGCRINRSNPLKGNVWNYNFCPNCGADMRQREDDNV